MKYQNELVNGAQGVYVAQTFVTSENMFSDENPHGWQGIDEQEIYLLSGDPDRYEDETYWEAWDRAQNNAFRVDANGVRWILHQDESGNLWEMVCTQYLETRVNELYADEFQKPEFFEGYHEVDGDGGTEFVPFSVVPENGDVSDFVESINIYEITPVFAGWLWRTTAPGYMDSSGYRACDDYRSCLIEAIEEQEEFNAQAD